jgi:Tfp pilus assembly protein PilO
MIVAGILVALNIGRLGTAKYHEILNGIDSKQALLGQYQMTTKNLDVLRQEIKQLEQRQRQFDGHLFAGESQNEITSAMQIKLQELLGSAGLSPESLRPTNRSSKEKDLAYGEVSIKLRLTGKLDNFLKFISALYRMNYFFKIENFTMKPFKKDQLKVFLEIKGFYRLTGGAQAESPVGRKTGR